MTEEEKGYYGAFKTRYPNVVLLLRTASGVWVAQHADMDHVLSVYPYATMSRDFVSVDDKRLDEIITSLKAKGLRVATAEQVAKASKGAVVELLPLMQSRLFECSNDDGLAWQPMPLNPRSNT